MKILKLLFSLIIILVLGFVLVIGYLGFIPGLSKVFGSDKPRDLGVKYSSANYDEAVKQAGVELKTLPEDTKAGASIIFSGKHNVDLTLSQEDLTAAANLRTWRNFPFSNVQIKINPDNSIEASGLVITDRVIAYAQALGASAEEINKAMEQYKIPKTTFPFYVKAAGSIKNNSIAGSLQSVEIGRLPVPESIRQEVVKRLIPVLDAKLSQDSGLSVTSATIENGKARFIGTLPDTESLVK